MTKGPKVKEISEARVEHWQKNGWSVATETKPTPNKETVEKQPAVAKAEEVGNDDNKGD